MTRTLIDAGPLVALLNRRDHHHEWIRDLLDTIEPPLFTCEPVVSEACFLLDEDFRIHRRHRRQLIPTIMPRTR